MTKKYVLGTEYKGGMSEICQDFPKNDNLVPGLAVSLDTDGKPVAVGTGIPVGVSGQEIYKVATPVIRSGIAVCVKLATGATVGNLGTAVKFNANGEVDPTGTVESAATIASEKVIGINPKDNSEVDAVLIDFPNGL